MTDLSALLKGWSGASSGATKGGGAKGGGAAVGFGQGLNTDQQVNLLQDLAAFVRVGLPPFDALQAMHDVAARRKRKRLATNLKMVLKRMSAGKSLGDALAGRMDATALTLVTAGEISGGLERSCKEAADLLIKRREMSSLVIKGLTMPFIQIAILTGLIYYIALQVVPAAGNLLPRESMGLISSAYFAFGEWFISWGPLTIFGVVATGVVIVATFSIWTGPLRTRVDGWFPWSIYRYVQSGGVLLTLASMMRAGIPFSQAVETASKHSGAWTKSRLVICRASLAKGRNEAQSLTSSGLLPPEIEDRLSVYARLPNLEQIMVPLSEDALSRAKQKVTSITGGFSVAVMLMMAFFIIFTVFGLGEAAMSAADAAEAGTSGASQ